MPEVGDERPYLRTIKHYRDYLNALTIEIFSPGTQGKEIRRKYLHIFIGEEWSWRAVTLR